MEQKAPQLILFLAALSLRCALAQEPLPEIPWVPADYHPAVAQPSPTPAGEPPPTQPSPTPLKPALPSLPASNSKEPGSLKKTPNISAWERTLEKLTPEQRQRFKENMERWNKLSKAQQEELRRTENMRRERLLKEVKSVIDQSRLELNGEQRQLFTLRYDQERRVIEEQLKKEMDVKRRAAMADLSRQLALEFKAQPPSNPVAPSPSPAVVPDQTAKP